jgi:hypothetical protein
MERGLGRHAAGRNRPRRGALHQRVDVRLIILVQCGRRAGAERDAQDRGEGEHRMHRHRRHQQAAQAGEDDERHHPRLGQRHKVPPLGGEDIGLGQRRHFNSPSC